MPDLVVMTRGKETTAVPEASVEGHEFYGWKRANKSAQADADVIRNAALTDPTNPAQEG